MTKTITATTTTIEAFISTLSRFNTFEVTYTSSNSRIPKTFICNSITALDIPDWNSTEISFNRQFLSPIKFSGEVISIVNDFSDAHSTTFSIHMRDGDSIDNSVEVVASYDNTIFIPTQPCQINDSFNSNKMIDYLMNPKFYDPNRSRPNDGLYVIDSNRLGTMTQRQEYIFENFMRFNLEQECYHDVLKTVCFMVKDWEVSIGLYNLESDAIEEMYEIGEEIDIGRLKQFACI